MSRRLSFEEWGPAEAETIVLLHGFMGRGADWQPVARQLRDRFRVVAPDLPGHGESLDLPSESYSLEGAVLAVSGLIDDLDLGRVSLVGYSMGGRVAYHVALREPGRLRGLVAASAHPGLESSHARAERRELDRSRAEHLTTDLDGFLAEWYRSPLFGTLARDQAARERLIRRRSDGNTSEWVRSLLGSGTGHQDPLRERLALLTVPTLLLAGEHDARYVALLGALSSSTGHPLVIVPDSGHAVHLEQPEYLARTLIQFFDQPIHHSEPCP